MNVPTEERARGLAKEARNLLANDKPKKAFSLFDQAASLYKKIGDSYNAAKCYASAATCWDIKSGGKILFNAASRYQYAAEEAMKYHDYEYAKFLYHSAARFYEKDGSPKWFSRCFYMAKLCEGRYAWCLAFASKKLKGIPGKSYKCNFKTRFGYFCTGILNTFFRLIWGYGENPWRVLTIAFWVVVLSSIIFCIPGSLNYNGQSVNHSYFDALYFSAITFTTLGYGDYQPIGYFRIVSMVEASSSLLLMPLFIISLTRKYLRTYY